MTAQPQHKVEASCQLPVGVQSRLMGSKKALGKRGNCSNSNPADSWRHEEACLGCGKLYWILCKWPPWGELCKGRQGQITGDEGCRSGRTRVSRSTHPEVAKEGECRLMESS